MMGILWRFAALIAVVAALLPLAAALLVSGIDDSSSLVILAGLIAGAAGVFGLIVLARGVFVVEQRRAGR